VPETGKSPQQSGPPSASGLDSTAELPGGSSWATSWAIDSTLARLPRWIASVSAAAVIASLLAGQVRFAAGLALGCGVALVGYWWLHRGIRAAFDSGNARAPLGVFIRLALRYPLAIGAVLLFDRTGWLPARAVMAGLFAPLAGVLIECSVLAVQSLRGRRGKAFTTEVTEAH
jgi:hypothetical protein